MAKKSKKKTATRKKTNSRPSKKKTAGKASRKPAVAAKKNSNPRASSNSVDSILKKFAKDRVQQETLLGGLRKKRADLEDKSKRLQEQITKLTQQEHETATRIKGLDQKRDEEVKDLLAKLGIKLDASVSHTSGQNQPRHPQTKQALAESRILSTPSNGKND